MVHTRRIFLSCCSVLTVLAMGCGDGGGAGAKSASDMSKPGGSSTPSDTAVDQNPIQEQTSFRGACVAACHAQGACLGFSDSDCTLACDSQAHELSSSCQDEATAEQECLKGLTCDQAKAYGTEGRRQHPVCGSQAQAYFSACTLDAGTTPAACSALCARYDACGASQVSGAACEEKCILQVTSYAGTSAACGDAFLAFIGCSGQAECAEVQELAATSLSPVACNDELEAMEQACN
jgi:hypothetical protein